MRIMTWIVDCVSTPMTVSPRPAMVVVVMLRSEIRAAPRDVTVRIVKMIHRHNSSCEGRHSDCTEEHGDNYGYDEVPDDIGHRVWE